METKTREPKIDQNPETEETAENPEQSTEGTEAEEDEVTETTRSESETIGYGQSEEEGEVNEKWPIRAEASFETSKKKNAIWTAGQKTRMAGAKRDDQCRKQRKS